MATITLNFNHIQNATAVSSSYNYGDDVTITATANPGYQFKKDTPLYAGYLNLNYRYIKLPFTVSGDRKTATVDVYSSVIATSHDEAVIYIEGETEPAITIYTVTKNLTHCSSSIPNNIDENTQFHWVIIADDGYEFNIRKIVGIASPTTAQTGNNNYYSEGNFALISGSGEFFG